MMFGVAALVVMVVICPQVGGLTEGVRRMSDYMKESGMSPMSSQTALSLVATILMTSFGTWGLPQMVGKFYAIKSEKDIHKGTVISTIFAIIVAGGCYFLGGFGRLYADRVVINEMTGKPLFDTIIPDVYKRQV